MWKYKDRSEAFFDRGMISYLGENNLSPHGVLAGCQLKHEYLSGAYFVGHSAHVYVRYAGIPLRTQMLVPVEFLLIPSGDGGASEK